jgi:hypothetical protein
MEVIIVAGVVVLAAVYVARNFYLKFKKGKSYGESCACPSCGCSDTCGDRQIGGHYPDACTIRDDITKKPDS